jgi:hypothetical protein
MSKVTTIGLKDALQNIQEAFPDMDMQVIKAVLFKTNGHVEKGNKNL